jgi:glycosyltransferase 2 family protein
VMTIWGDVGSVSQELARFHWWVFPLALALAFTNYLIRFLKWQYYLSLLRIRIPWGESFLVFLSSLMLTVTPGKLGEVLKSYLLKRSRSIAMSITAPIVVAERLTDLLALIGLTLIGLSTYRFGLEATLASLGLVLACLLSLSMPSVAFKFLDFLGRIPLIRRFTPKLRIAYQSMRTMVTPRPLFFCTFLSMGAWWLECLAFYLVISGFEASSPSLLAATFLYAFTTILGALSFIPGGLGVTEGSMSVGLVQMGMLATSSHAVAATVIIRFATLWFAVALGVIAFTFYRRRLQPAPDQNPD